MLLLLPLTLCGLITSVWANTEKVIFLAPGKVNLPDTGPSLAELALDILSPVKSSLRASLPREFGNEPAPDGVQSWYLLNTLHPYKRYEVRVCWPATQPTRFSLEKYTLDQVFDTPDLVSSLATYSESRQGSSSSGELLDDFTKGFETQQSLLFLRIWAAADYFTTNATLMREPPPVDVDIILDPYLLNVFPQSLLPTAAYIAVLAICSWYLSGIIWDWLKTSARTKQRRD